MDLDNNKGDGSDIFWPGYVDAVTNLVLNLLFLLTIMTVAVFMFALELGRASLGGTGKTPVTAVKAAADNTQTVTTGVIKEREAAVAALKKQVESLDSKTPADAEALRKQVATINSALKREVEFLNMMRLQEISRKQQAGAPFTTVAATSAVPKPKKGLERLQTTESEVIVRFTDEAVTLTQAELTQLREALKPIVASGGARIYTQVPAGFSEAKRMGFYRAMAVRNLLIEMKMPKKQIDVSVREGKSDSNASLVRVMPK